MNPDLVHHAHHLAMAATIAHHRLFLTAARATSPFTVGALARRLRGRGHEVITPYEVGPEPLDNSVAYGRAAADVILDSDAVVLLAGWETDSQTISTRELADAFGIPTYEWQDADVEDDDAENVA